ncbi:MAG: xanthine dehydrogenase family protein molybdopterin-binding subunit, partial [Pseudomonadota bacterium]
MDHDDDTRLLRGQGLYLDDHQPTDALRLVVLRSPMAHARIRRLDLEAARRMPGVRLVVGSVDLLAAGLGPLDCPAPITGEDGKPMVEPYRPVLAEEKVVHVGQPVAAVVADTEALALDAVEAIELDLEPLPAVVDVTQAARPDAALIWPEAPDNTSFTWSRGNAQVVERALAQAAHVVELTIRHPRVAVAPIETRGAIARMDADGRLTLWTPSQGVVAIRTAMAECLNLPPSALRVVTDDVGGSFAVKIWPYPEQALVLHAARVLRKPVKWVATRSESFTSDVVGRGRVDHAQLALDEDGRFLAFRVEALADLGAFVNAGATNTVAAAAVRVFNQTYRIPGQHYRVRAMFTNAMPTDAYRGAGKPESVNTLERLIDLAAYRLGIDRLELRRRNFLRPDDLPYATPMGETLDTGDFPGLADALEAKADLAGFGARRASSNARGRLRGLGLTFHMHGTGGATSERSEVRALPDGTVIVRTGTQDSGQGHRRVLARVAAEALDLPEDRIRVEQGDSDVLEVGGGTGGSNVLSIGGATVHRTALAMLDQAKAKAAEVLEAAEVDLAYGDGAFTIRGTDRRLTLWDLAKLDEETPDDLPSCVAQRDFAGNERTFPNGAYACEVEVDPETGAVEVVKWTGIDDIGRVFDPPGALGQNAGGIAQSIGEALGEALVYDSEGQLLTGSLMDYFLPRAADVPSLDLGFRPTASPNSPIGAKGVGELSSIGAVACMLNAVHHALREQGVIHLDRPLTPLRVWQALQAA